MMAPLVCSFCEQEYAILMVTNISDGDTKGVGGACASSYALSMAAAFTADLSPGDAQELGELFDQITANDKRPAIRGKRQSKGESTQVKQPSAQLMSGASEMGTPDSQQKGASANATGNTSAGALTDDDLRQIEEADNAEQWRINNGQE